MSIEKDEQIAILRQELKVWEKTFAAANGGRKAGREDIKRDAAIAAKYREYDRLRRPEQKRPTSRPASTSTKPTKDAESTSQAPRLAATPQKRKSQIAVPALPAAQSLAGDKRVAVDENAEEEDDELEPTPAAIRMQLGPTPLKDGQILSLFDSFPSVTPSKSRSALNVIQGNIAATPSKRQPSNGAIAESPAMENARHSRSPTSAGKRFMLDSFATPLKRKRDEQDDVHRTPSSSMKLLATPAFLRRSNTMSIMDSLAEEAEQDGEMHNLTRPRGPPFKKKRGFVRSLSSIIQGMRKREDDILDEEMEMMREMDDFDDVQQSAPPKKPAADSQSNKHQAAGEEVNELPAADTQSDKSQTADVQISKPQPPEVLVEDSQIVMPLGPDRLSDSDEESDEEDENGLPKRKAWKKKGLKRQTKRVMMRPVAHKSKKADPSTQTDLDPNTEAETNPDHEIVLDTQIQPIILRDGFADESDYSDTEAKLQRAQTQASIRAAAKSAVGADGDTREGPVKKAVRMISSGAHANFRRLHIRNQNSKAKGKGRFGRK